MNAVIHNARRLHRRARDAGQHRRSLLAHRAHRPPAAPGLPQQQRAPQRTSQSDRHRLEAAARPGPIRTASSSPRSPLPSRANDRRWSATRSTPARSPRGCADPVPPTICASGTSPKKSGLPPARIPPRARPAATGHHQRCIEPHPAVPGNPWISSAALLLSCISSRESSSGRAGDIVRPPGLAARPLAEARARHR